MKTKELLQRLAEAENVYIPVAFKSGKGSDWVYIKIGKEIIMQDLKQEPSRDYAATFTVEGLWFEPEFINELDD